MPVSRIALTPLEGREAPAILTGLPAGAVAVPADPGSPPVVRLIDPTTGATLASETAYEESFRGGVNVALGDVTGDGVRDLVLAPGAGGGPRVRILDGKTGNTLADFFVYEPTFTGGVSVAAGDVNADGKADIVTGTGVGGGPRVRVLDGATLGRTVLKDYFAYESSFRGGVQVAAGDLDGDGRAEVVTGTGVGGGPRVVAFDAVTDRVVRNFFAYEESFRGGVQVAAGDLDGDGTAEVVTGSGVGGGPVVRVFGDAGRPLATVSVGDPLARTGALVDTADLGGTGVRAVVARTVGGPVQLFQGLLPAVVVPVTPAPMPTPTVVQGTVQSVDPAAGTVVLQLAGGQSLVVRTAGSTAFVRDGQPAGLAAVRAGDRAEVTVGADGLATAFATTAGAGTTPPTPEPEVPGADAVVSGTVAAVDPAAGTVRIQGDAGRVFLVTLTAETVLTRGGATVTLAALAVGDFAEARTDAAGDVTRVVAFAPLPEGVQRDGRGPGVGVIPVSSRVTGTVTAVDPAAGTLTITTDAGRPYQVPVTDRNTVERNGQRATLADVLVGDKGEARTDQDGVVTEVFVSGP